MASIISGTGIYLPERIVTNDDLARLMDTGDEWIRQRTGVVERRIAAEGEGTSHLAARAGQAALADAGVDVGEVDSLVLATMTPDFYAPGSAPLVQNLMGLGPIPAHDIHQQCSGFLFGLDFADSLISTERAETVLVIGAEVHTMYMPWANQIGPLLESGVEPSKDEYAYNTRFRDWSVLFGDGAGAFVMTGSDDEDAGWQHAILRTDGAMFNLIQVPGLGSRSRPYVDSADIAKGNHMPAMNGGQLFRNAVRLMPEVTRELLEATGHGAVDMEVVIAHQANGRIVEAVRRDLDLDPERVPMNLDRYGNTTAASLPILYHELRGEGRLNPGDLVCFVAFGGGAHWGAGLYREVAR